MKDPITTLAHERLAEMALDLTVQLEKGTGTRPMLWLLSQSRHRAVTAIYALVKIDPSKTEDIRHLQNEVNLYDDMMTSALAMIQRGDEADRAIVESDREAVAEFLTTQEAREAGLEPKYED